MFKAVSILKVSFLFLLSWVIPKKKGLIVFYPIHYKKFRFNGNIKSLFIFMFENLNLLTIRCINVASEEVEEYKQFKGSLLTGKYTLNNIFLLLRAEKIIIDSGINFYGKFKLYQLWHGTGFKNIGFLNKKNTFIEKLKFKLMSKQLKLVVATSGADKERKIKSFNTSFVEITGAPRNDLLLDKNIIEKDLRSELSLPSDGKIILYLPTFRESRHFSPFSDGFYHDFNTWLSEKNCYFVIKKHPNDNEFELQRNWSNIIDLKNSNYDTQKLLKVSNVLVSDYSGVISDYALLRRPILLFGHDYDEYLKTCRDFYYYPDKLLNRGLIKNENELLLSIKEVIINFDNLENEDFLKKFHKYIDSDSCKRVSEFILRD